MALQLMEINFAADDATMELVNRMKQDTNRLLHLMESVLSFSRSADRKLEPVNLDVSPMPNEYSAMNVSSKVVRIILGMNKVIDERVWGDPDKKHV